MSLVTRSSLVGFQLTREVPPGYGGVERLVHILGESLPSSVVSLRLPNARLDPLPVCYERFSLPSLCFGRVFVPLPSLQLIRLLLSSAPIVAHLPCPTILFLTAIIRLISPKRKVVVFWHAFLHYRFSFQGLLEYLYQTLALCLARSSTVITTSPVLRRSLLRCGCRRRSVKILPCALSLEVEDSLLQLRVNPSDIRPKGRIIFIGRLNSYKRVDWLVQAIAKAPAVLELHVLGDGPDLSALERLVNSTITYPQRVFFHGQVSEKEKQRLLGICDLMVLPSDCCNEAFGIVQLEAMAAGIPSLAFNIPNSGMHWVSCLDSLDWSGSPSELSEVLQRIFNDPRLLIQLTLEARNRYDQYFSNYQWLQSLTNLQAFLRN